jgi:hypothetical protein
VHRSVTTALEPGEPVAKLVERCHALADLGIQHVVVIARGRPLTDTDLNCVVGAANQIAA